jgi:acetylornithine deacetylase/succinyl-diaminopimelate desuccinylase-like protein
MNLLEAFMRVYCCCAVLALLVFPLPKEIDWAEVRTQAVTLLQEMIRIDTTNPPGRERGLALHLQRLLESDGIETRLLDVGPDRANLYARIRGDGSRRPIILLSHMDVVEANSAEWSVPPFSGEIRNGYVYGRGALDMKGTGAVHATLLRLLKRQGLPLKRDVILLAVADEEAGGLGAQAMVKNHPELIRDAEFLLNEGDVVYVRDGKAQQYGVDVMEKAPLWLRIIAKGDPGHASIPNLDSSVNRLLNALQRLRSWEPPVKVSPAVATGYRFLAARQNDPLLKKAYADLERALKDPALRKKLLEDSSLNAQVRNTLTITGLHGSEKVNVIPGTAWAQVDVRLLPGETPEAFLVTLKQVLADPTLEIEVLTSSIPTGSPPESALMDAIRKVAARYDRDVPVVPTMLTSSTDSPTFRQLGIIAYGFEPFKLDDGELDRSHGKDERVSVDNIGFALRFLYEVVVELNT